MLHKARSPPTKPTYCPVPVLILVYLKSSKEGKKVFFPMGMHKTSCPLGLFLSMREET